MPHQIIDGIEYKLCSKGKHWKVLSDFYPRKASPDGLNYSCEACKRGHEIIKPPPKYKIINGIKHRLCAKGQHYKLLSEFRNDSSAKDKLNPTCTDCHKATDKLKKDKHIEFTKNEKIITIVDHEHFLQLCESDHLRSCGGCFYVFPIVCFTSLETVIDEFVKTCIKCRESTNKHYYKASEPYRKLFEEFKSAGCIDCGTIVAIEADHRNPEDKVYILSEYSYWIKYPVELYLNELAKCDRRCAECHSLKTKNTHKPKENYSSQERILSRQRQNISSRKVGMCCEICNKICEKGFECAFDYDHIDQTTKSINISDMQVYSSEEIEFEISKCRLLCKNCDRVHSTKQKEEFTENRLNFIHNHFNYPLCLLENFNI
jgi:hypothetical protein